MWFVPQTTTKVGPGYTLPGDPVLDLNAEDAAETTQERVRLGR